MSNLVTKLRIAARLEPAPMGFTGVNVDSPRPKPVLIARVGGEARKVVSLVKGADAVFIDTHQEEVADKIIKQLGSEKGKNKTPIGCWLGNNPECKSDFNVLVMDTDMTLLKNAKEGKVLVVEPNIEDKYLKFLDDLPVDAIMVARSEGQPCRLTLESYVLCQRMALAISKPLVVHVGSNIGPQELSDMWDYGIDGVMVDVDSVNPSLINKFRGVIDSLDLAKKRKKIRLTPVIPANEAPQSGSSGEPYPDEDDDEEPDGQ